jgi:hypothetical protein
LRICERGDGVMTVPTTNELPVVISHRAIFDEHVLSKSPSFYEMRIDTIHGIETIRRCEDEQKILDVGQHFGWILKRDDRNRLLETFKNDPAHADASEFSLSISPMLASFYDVTYPASGVHVNDSFPLRVKRTIHEDYKIPSDLDIDAKFVVTRVDPDAFELACKGRQRQRAANGKEYVQVDFVLTCHARIERRDNRTGHWVFDARGTIDQSKTKWATVRSHYDVAIGDADAGVCERAAE